jgi:hypothetical protein
MTPSALSQASIASRQHHKGMVRETWSLPASHDSQMSAKHFLVDNLIEGLRREKALKRDA